MRHLVNLVMISVLMTGALSAQSLQPNPNRPATLQPNPNRAVRPRAEAAIADVVQGLFIAQFQQQVQVSDEQYVKILPLLRQGIEGMRTNANRSLVAVNRLRQLIRANASEDELNTQIREVDESQRQTMAAQQAFVSKIDPFLTADQKARFRLFQSTFDQRLRELMQRARQLNQPANPQ
jgi:hypothetical protein